MPALLGTGRAFGSAEPVEVRETHCSWVFLLGTRAYKVKKPVTFPFLDQSELSARRRLCRAEVELNRRLAPSVYLGVSSVLSTEDGLIVADEDRDDAVEYAVRMERYRDEETLAWTIGHSVPAGRPMGRTGALLADFHAQASAVKPDHYEQTLRTQIIGTLDELASQGSGPSARRLGLATDFVESFLGGRIDELCSRAAGGQVRDGHGDLRCEHVLLRDPIEVVDCIEFDSALRTVDVACDLAFLVMDVERLAGPGAARPLIRGYEAAGGQSGDVGLLSFFAAYRAWVRAEVALLRARQVALDGESALVGEAAGLFTLGERFAWRARGGSVICIAGVAASGKTSLGAELAQRSGFRQLTSDVVRKELAGLDPGEHADAALYAPAKTTEVYGELGRRAGQAVLAGESVIVDATFHRREARDTFRAALPAYITQPFHVECAVPPEVAGERARRRSDTPEFGSDAGPEVVGHQLEQAEPPEEIALEDLARIDTNTTVRQAADEVELAMNRRLAAGPRKNTDPSG